MEKVMKTKKTLTIEVEIHADEIQIAICEYLTKHNEEFTKLYEPANSVPQYNFITSIDKNEETTLDGCRITLSKTK